MADAHDPRETGLTTERLLAYTTLDDLLYAVLITDSVGFVQYVNHAAVQLLGVTRGGARGQPAHEILKLHDGATDQPIVAPLSFLLSNADVLSAGSYVQLVRGDGTKLPIDCSITINANRHRTTALVLTLRDASPYPRGHQTSTQDGSAFLIAAISGYSH